VTARGERDDATLATWAKEHLVYEVDMMVFALERLEGEVPETRGANLALESFAVHARCLFEFLWCKPNPNYDNDAFASDFSDEWNGRRDAIPQYLAEVKDRRRFGQEVFHLTFNRISGSGDDKVWLCGQMAMEISNALKLFTELARPVALDDDTRARLGSVAVKVEGADGSLTDEILRLSHRKLAAVAGATTMDPSQFKGGTINPLNLEGGS
jgi:hypothetical protein